MKLTRNHLRRMIQEAMPAGGVPDMVGYLNKGRPDPIVDAMLDDYEDFVEREGHITRGSSSVAASFFMQSPELRDDHDAHQALADAIGLDHDEIMRDMERQKREQGIQEGSKMKITKNQLRRIIKEEKEKLLRENMEELPPPGADRKQLVSTDATILAEDYIQKAVYDGLEEMGLDENGANEVIRQLYNRPDLLKDAIADALNDYKRKLGRPGKPKPRNVDVFK